MLLAFLLLACFLCGSFGVQYEVCYGGTFRFPSDYSPPRFNGELFFTPKNGEGKRLVFENGKVMDPRLNVTSEGVSLPHVTEKDNGYFSRSRWYLNRITLKVLECADSVQRYYHTMFRVNIPSNAEIVEFSSTDKPDPVILWNRTQTSGASRVRVKQSSWEMSDLTQADNGYYNIRKKDYTLLSRKKLTVTEHTKDYKPKEGTHFTMRFPVSFTPWDITFKPSKGNWDPIRVMHSGRLTKQNAYLEDSHFEDRFSLERHSLELLSLKVEDAGIYEFRDNNSFLIFVANMEVEEVHTPAYVYVIFFVAIVAALAICCFCIRRCCCKKSASKTNAPQTTQAAAPAPGVSLLSYHITNEPTGPSYSATPRPATYSYQPVNPVVPREPSAAPASVGPPAYNRVDIHPGPNATQLESSQVVVSTEHNVAPAPSLAFDCFSSDPDPKFELKGLRFSSDLPLNSDSTFASVYTSDKLNF